MPLGIVDDKDFEKELNNSNRPIIKRESKIPVVTGEVITRQTPGRKELESTNVPQSLRAIIGDTYANDSRGEGLELAESFGISKSSASAYGNGATSTASYNKPNDELVNQITGTKNRIIKRAHNKLLSTLSHITDDKLAEAKVGELATVAKAMSGVIKDLEPAKNPNENKMVPQFIVYSPRVTNESNYDVTFVNDAG